MTTVIQIRGTSGSGKTYVMRKVISRLGALTPVCISGRKKPLYYTGTNAVVLGHYESNCGGCDNVGSARHVYELTKKLSGPVILQEGLLLSEDTKWTIKLVEEGYVVRIVFLTTPLDRCLEQIESRRRAVGNLKPLNPHNTVNRVAVIERARKKLFESGVCCRRVGTEQAVGVVIDWMLNAG